MKKTLARLALALGMLLVLGTSEALAQRVAWLAKAAGTVEVDRGSGFQPVAVGQSLRLEDSVRTGEDGVAQIRFDDAGVSGSDATVIDLTPSTVVRLDHFEVSRGPRPQRSGLISLITGFVRAAAHGWSNGSMFSVKAGTTVCGIRGSESFIRFEPKEGGGGTATVVFSNGDIVQFEVPDRGGEQATMMEILATAARISRGDSDVEFTKMKKGDVAKSTNSKTQYMKVSDENLGKLKGAFDKVDAWLAQQNPKDPLSAALIGMGAVMKTIQELNPSVLDVLDESGFRYRKTKIVSDVQHIDQLIQDQTSREEFQTKFRGAAGIGESDL